jgi:hypothetical protein
MTIRICNVSYEHTGEWAGIGRLTGDCAHNPGIGELGYWSSGEPVGGWAGRWQVDEKRPCRALEHLRQVVATRTKRRQIVKVGS